MVKWLTWPYLILSAAVSRETPLARILLIIPAFIYCAVSWPRIALQLHTGEKADKNLLARHCFGFTDPLLSWDREGSFSHRAIDYLVEWTKLSGQRTAKLGCFVILCLVVIAVIGWAI